MFTQQSAPAEGREGGELASRALRLPASLRGEHPLLARPRRARTTPCQAAGAPSRLRHRRGLPPERCEEPTQRWAQSRRRCLRLRGVGRALCLRLQHPRSDQTHPDHTCITERPLAWIGFIFWYKSHDCPAAFESCDVTVSNSYTVSLQLSRLTHTLGDGALNASWLWKRAANA